MLQFHPAFLHQRLASDTANSCGITVRTLQLTAPYSPDNTAVSSAALSLIFPTSVVSSPLQLSHKLNSPNAPMLSQSGGR